jgi:hypothetical protein
MSDSTKGGYLIRIVGHSFGFRGTARRVLFATHQQPNVTLYENGTVVPSTSPYPPDWRVRVLSVGPTGWGLFI